MPLNLSLPMDFSSVDDFLQRATAAKQGERRTIADNLEPWLEDDSVYALPPQSAALLEEAIAKYGDEALKQFVIVCLGKWCQIHEGFLKEHTSMNKIDQALLTCADLTKIAQALQMISSIGSFSGDEHYRKAMKEQIGQAVLEQIEETGMSVGEIFHDDGNDKFSDPLL